MKHPKRLQWVLNGLQSRNIDFSSASEYGEPGYSTDKPVILFANWNDLEHKGGKREYKALDAVAECEWYDEWTTDCENRAFRTQPDSHFWSRSFFEHDGEIVPYDTLPQDGDALRDALRDYGFFYDPSDTVFQKAVPACIDEDRLASFAEKLPDHYETGMHPWQTDKPEKILAALPPGEYFFRVSESNPFSVGWQVWRVSPEGQHALTTTNETTI